MADEMKLVPVEPTEAMIEAMDQAVFTHGNVLDAYRAMLAASPPAREEAPADGAGEDDLAEFLARKFRANIYDYPHKSVTKSDEHTINLFADVAAEALRNRTSEPEAGVVAWLLENHSTGTGPICTVHPGEWPNTTVYPLFKHPAPATADKLRVAVEALERLADPRNIHFAGDAQVVASKALAVLNEQPQ